MNKTSAYALFSCLAVIGGVATVASLPQDSTKFPGPTQARVWIQNQGRSEAVPMTLQSVAPDMSPMNVLVSGTPTVRLDTGNVVPVREIRQRWEYRCFNIGPADDPTVALNAAGDDGWDATGLVFPGRTGTVVVMKRPR
jgi:hypothetical protein